MRLLKLTTLLALLAIVSPSQAEVKPIDTKPIDIILIGGQSNATGQGLVQNIPATYKIDKSVQIFYSKYLNKGVGAEKWQPLRSASENTKRFGYELSLGTKLKSELPDREIAIIKHSRSGSNLYEQWNPDGEGGEEYNKFIDCVEKGIAELRKMGYTPTIHAMAWQQGEADARFNAGDENSYRYADNLKNFIEKVRTRLNVPEMLFVYGEVMPLVAERFTQRDTVRAAQVAVSELANTRHSVKGAILVEGDDLQMRSTDYHTVSPTDDVHLGTFGQLTLGERFADEIVKRLK